MNEKEKQISKDKMKALDNLLTEILRDSNEEDREELKKVLWKWKARTLFVDALQEEKDIQDQKEKNL